jgi:hypothetical protein
MASYDEAYAPDGMLRGKVGETVVDPSREEEPGVSQGGGSEAPTADLEELQGADIDDEPDGGAENKERRSVASKLVDIALQHYDLGQAEDGSAYAVKKNGPRVGRPLRGKLGLRSELARLYFIAEGTAPNSQALADAINVLEGYAGTKDREPRALRVGHLRENLVLDLGTPDGSVVVLEPARWSVRNTSPVLLRRSELTGALPMPSRDGSLNQLRELLNVSDDDWHLVVGWLVAALDADIPHPVLAVFGEQGTGKSTLVAFIVRVLDPGPAPLRTAPRDPGDWVVAAAGSWLVALDNLSRVPEWLGDCLCRAVTGDGLVRRALYSDGDLAVTAFRRVVALTSIDAGSIRGDLAERLLPITCERIEASRRRLDREVEAHFAAVHPQILGALLDLTAAVLKVLPGVDLAEMPRMADFARVLAAVDKVMGWKSFEYYLQVSKSSVASGVEDDAVAQAILEYLGDRPVVNVTAADLLAQLTPGRPSKDWPASARGLSGRLRRLAPALREVGVNVTFISSGHDKRHLIMIARAAQGEDEETRHAARAARAARSVDQGEQDEPERHVPRHVEDPDHATCREARDAYQEELSPAARAVRAVRAKPLPSDVAEEDYPAGLGPGDSAPSSNRRVAI